MEQSQTSTQTHQQLSIRAHLENIDDLVIQFNEKNQYGILIDYDQVCKRVLQGFHYVTSGKKNIRLVVMNFYGKEKGREIPIFSPKNWNIVVASMMERQINQIEIRVLKTGELRQRRVRQKNIPVEFNEDGQIESAEDDAITTAIAANMPIDQPYKGSSIVRCHFCQHTSRDEKVSRESGPFYGPFVGKRYAHLLCLLWYSHVFLDEELHLCGVNQALKESQTMKCKMCKNKGASFYCHASGCRTMSHYRCASNSGWYFDWVNFKVYCPKQNMTAEDVSVSTKTLTNRQKMKLEAKMEIEEVQKKEECVKQSASQN